ncbi:MAG: polyribonucleotide nucleotidyltransferase [Elusimicrobiota bacterium]|nr:polyribonucleotide nucleotidyltransferase [Elusimicrobiota bacterium]
MQKEIKIGSKSIVIEVGKLAKQTNGSATVRIGETAILATVVISREKLGFDKITGVLPLTVDYRERTYAAGKIPGGFFKREGRPREKEILTSRLVDRTIRPLLAKQLAHEIQLNILVLSSDGEHDSDSISVLGASAALLCSDIPFETPVGCTRVGYINNEFVIDPTYEQQEASLLDLIVAGTSEKVIMLEGSAKELQEELVIKAIEFAKPHLSKMCEIQNELRKEYKKEKLPLSALSYLKPSDEIVQAVKELLKPKMHEIVKITDKILFELTVDQIKKNIVEELKTKFALDADEEKLFQVNVAFEEIFREEVRNSILTTNLRQDGRLPQDLRDINCSISFLPRLHGSALFRRGQTQALVTVTLGLPKDMQVMDELEREYKERFMFHYNFPGFATGSIKPDRGPTRREIGHGALAKRALYPVLPTKEEFPYTIRMVSDILESNGSSSMASVCGGSLALFDAGVPLRSAVGGVAMGMIKENNSYVILTDIIGLEDKYGDMDFKIAGTDKGITAIQLDLKIYGIDTELISEILNSAKLARKKILDKMNSVISKPKETLSEYAPRMFIVQIPQTKIGDLIGPGGKIIRKIVEESGVNIDVEDDGRVFISGDDPAGVELAKQMVEYYTADVEVGKVYRGKVTRTTDFGAFVEILPGKEGLVHISQLADYKVRQVSDVVRENDEILVRVLEIDDNGRINLSRKAALRDRSRNNGR